MLSARALNVLRLLVAAVLCGIAGLDIAVLVTSRPYRRSPALITFIVASLCCTMTMISTVISTPRTFTVLPLLAMELFVLVSGAYWLGTNLWEVVAANARSYIVAIFALFIVAVFGIGADFMEKLDHLVVGKRGTDDQLDGVAAQPELQFDGQARSFSPSSGSLASALKFNQESINTGSSSDKTVRVKDSMQTLVPQLAEKTTVASASSTGSRSISQASASAPSVPSVPSTPPNQVARIETISEKSTPIASPARSPVLLPDSQFSDSEQSLKNINVVPPLSLPADTIQNAQTPQPSPTQSHFRFPARSIDPIDSLDNLSGLPDNDSIDDVLKNLSDIPEVSTDRWPMFSTGTDDNMEEIPIEEDEEEEDQDRMRHISLDSWNNNADHWHRNRERLGMINSKVFASTSQLYPGPPPPPSSPERTELQPLELVRSYSDLGSTLSEEVAAAELMTTPSSPSKDKLETLYGNIEATDDLNSITHKSFYQSYETLTKLSPQRHNSSGTPPSPSPSHSLSHRKTISGTLRINTSGLHYQRSNMSLRSAVYSPKKCAPPFPASNNTSPLKRLRSVRFSSTTGIVRADSFSRKHCAHSQSQPELTFEYIKALQSSPSKRSGSINNNHHSHHQTHSSVSSRGLHKSPLEHNDIAVCMEEDEADDNEDEDDENENTSSSDSTDQSMPSMVMGEYDREKWRVLQRHSQALDLS